MSFRSLFVCTAICLSAGCGAGVKLEHLEGTATFSGQPITYGTVEFVPDAAQGHRGPVGEAEIVDGRFSTKLSGRGVIPGQHQVRVTGYTERPAPALSDDETQPTDIDPPLFLSFPIEMDLKGGTITIEVPESAKGYDPFQNAAAGRRSDDP